MTGGKIMDKSTRDFFEKCIEEINNTNIISYEPDKTIDEEYALIREIDEITDDRYIQILAVGDKEGMLWLYEKACEHFDNYNGGVMKMSDFHNYGEKVEFH